MLILAVILGIFFGLPLLLGALVLFVPIRYKVQMANDTGKFQINVRLSWFLGFFRLRYENKVFQATVFWFKKLGKKKRKSVKASKTESAPKENTKKDEDEQSAKPNILGTIKKVLTHPDRKEIWGYAKVLIRRLLRGMKPDKFKLTTTLGFENIVTTGYALGLLGIIQGVTGLDINASGDFTNKTFRYNLFVKDALFLWPLAWAITVFCLKRPVWAIIKKYFFKKDEKNGRKVKAVL